jgi:hypothetical protein
VEFIPPKAECMQSVKLAQGIGESGDPGCIGDKDTKVSQVTKENGKDA